jgi:carboxymethylenebutenolidase
MAEIQELSSSDGPFPVYVTAASGNTKGGLIVIHEVWGLVDHIKAVADRFAGEGYLVIAPNLLNDLGITNELASSLQEELFDPERRSIAQPKLRELMAPMQAPDFGEKTLARIQACYQYLKEQPGINERIAITGFCFGGTYSFSLAVHEPNLKAAVPFYGHADFSIEELKNIHCPILAFYGKNDERLISQLPQLKEKMSKANVNFTAQVYENCGHAFFNDTNKFTYNQAAASDAWSKTITFLAEHMS